MRGERLSAGRRVVRGKPAEAAAPQRPLLPSFATRRFSGGARTFSKSSPPWCKIPVFQPLTSRCPTGS